ncbi:MAG: hypothetical protein DSM106950_17460 [Stigonema ocellatum SAG 48.90 = DSM 106950]|nr:hypothetical protein [Stigonema ocellatum SAG 48.90 = DSM 106950]
MNGNSSIYELSVASLVRLKVILPRCNTKLTLLIPFLREDTREWVWGVGSGGVGEWGKKVFV